MRDVWYLIAFWSRKFITTKRNYSTPDAKLLAIFETFKEWKPYLKGVQYTVKIITNYKNLQYFISIKALNRR
jgi:hypothetical protein